MERCPSKYSVPSMQGWHWYPTDRSALSSLIFDAGLRGVFYPPNGFLNYVWFQEWQDHIWLRATLPSHHRPSVNFSTLRLQNQRHVFVEQRLAYRLWLCVFWQPSTSLLVCPFSQPWWRRSAVLLLVGFTNHQFLPLSVHPQRLMTAPTIKARPRPRHRL